MSASEIKYRVELPDGSTRELGEHQTAAITALKQAISDIAGGVTQNISLVEVDGEGGNRWSLFTFSAEQLDTLADVLFHQSKTARKAASAWEGNARAAARSYMTH